MSFAHKLQGSKRNQMKPQQDTRLKKFKLAIYMSCASILLVSCAGAKLPPPPTENEMLVNRFEDGELIAKEIERGVVVYLPNVFFKSGSTDMTEQAKDKIVFIAEVSNEDFVKDRLIVLEGHTDSDGSEAYNMELSKVRTQKTEAALIENNLDSERISTFWFGETKPLVPNKFSDGSDNPAGRSTNRRVEFILLN